MGLPENIDALLVKFDINQDALARVAGVSPSSVTRWRNGAQMRKDSLEKICTYFDLEEDDLISDNYGLAAKEHGQIFSLPAGAMRAVPCPTVTIPLVSLGKVHAGELTDEEAVERQIQVPEGLRDHHPRGFFLTVEGDCMNRVIPNGAHVLVDPDKEPSNGSIAVVETEDYQAVMRRWYRGSSTLLLSADSYEDYEDLVFGADDGPVKVIGTVVWYQAPEEME